MNPLTFYKHLLNSRNAYFKANIQVYWYNFLNVCIIYYMENIKRDVILLRQNVVTSSGRTVTRPTRLDLLILAGYVLCLPVLLIRPYH